MKLTYESDINNLNLSDFGFSKRLMESVGLEFKIRHIPTLYHIYYLI